jgi:hypothetical protein
MYMAHALTIISVFLELSRNARVSFSLYRGLNSLVHPSLRFFTFLGRSTREPSQ